MSLKASNKVDTNRWELEVEVGAEQFEDAIARVFKREAKEDRRFRDSAKEKRRVRLLRNITASRSFMRMR